MHSIIHSDILDWARDYQGEPFHAAFCDAPYHLDGDGRDGRGFMGKAWDGGDIAFRPETWAAIAQHVHPGGFIASFASSRGWHRMAVAMEDAGLIIQPTIFVWLSANRAWPKATRLDEQIDRRAGAEREIVGQKRHQPKFNAAELGYREKDNGYNSRNRQTYSVTEPATPLAQAWAGHRYGGQVLKPAVDPIIVAQRPWPKARRLDAIIETGAGAMWIDGVRKTNTPPHLPGGYWPTNFACTHAPTCEAAHCAPDCPASTLGEKAQHFFRASWASERIEAASAVGYFAKASTAEREAGLADFPTQLVGDGRATPIDNPYQRGKTPRKNIHPTIKPIALNRWLATLLLPPAMYAPRRLLVPFAGAGSEIIGAMQAGWEEIVGVELEAEHVRIAQARLAFWSAQLADQGRLWND